MSSHNARMVLMGVVLGYGLGGILQLVSPPLNAIVALVVLGVGVWGFWTEPRL